MSGAITQRRSRAWTARAKGVLQQTITGLHRAFLLGELPPRVAVCFHSVEADQWGRFEEALAYFADLGYEFCAPQEFCGHPRKAVFLSFDDNYHSWVQAAARLQARGLRASFYLNTCAVAPSGPEQRAAYYERLAYPGDRTPLSASEILALAGAGHTIASHTHSHYRLTALPLAQAKEEIRRGKQELENLLGRPVLDFAFPYGMRRHFSERLRRYCRELGFVTIASAIPGMQYRRQLPTRLDRSPWALEKSLEYNLRNLRVDGRVFQRLTGRSAVV